MRKKNCQRIGPSKSAVNAYFLTDCEDFPLAIGMLLAGQRGSLCVPCKRLQRQHCVADVWGTEASHVVDSQPTIYDVAQRAGVSIATVSRALNSVSSVRPATRDKVLAVIRELEFVPNSVARGLSSGKHWILGLVFMQTGLDNNVLAVEEASLLYTDIVIRGAEARAAAHGYSLLLCGAGENHPPGMTPVMNLTGTVDGLIVLDRVMTEDDVADLARRIPVVLMAGTGNSSSAITVRVDNEQAMRSLARHFIDVHHVRRGGFVSGDPR